MDGRLFGLDFQLLHDAVLMIIAIFALVLIASNLLFNPARKFLEDRKKKIKDDLENAKKDQEDAAALKAEYETKLKDINKEAESILEDARKRGQKNEEKIIAAAKEEANGIIERAKTEATLEKQKAQDEVKREMVVLASMIAGKVVKTSIDTTVQESLVNETLNEIGESTWQS